MRLPSLAIASLLWTFSLYAQESRGDFLGHVTDSSGAVVPGAKVKAVNIATNTTLSADTNAEGNYEIRYVLPGEYQVMVEKVGFRPARRGPVELRVGDRLTLDFSLELGSLSDAVTVSAEAPLLDVSSSAVGTVMDSKRVSELPMVGGNPFYLSRLAPGVASASTGRTAGNPMDTGGITGSVNGSPSGTSDISVDGVSNMYKRSTSFSPPQDLVQEFRVQTSLFDASQGHAAGGVLNVSTKSGTNSLHGTVYGFYSPIRAVPWFSNKFLYDPNTGPIDDQKRLIASPGWLHERWGTTAGGPLWIPKVYNGRNKTFWSFGYEGLYIQREPTFTGTVPTVAERNGDFSALLKLGSQYQIYDPLTTTAAANGRFQRQPLAGNIIPANRIDPIAQKILSFYPLPNNPGTADGRQNFFGIQEEKKDYYSTLGRLDHNFSERHRIFFRANQNTYLHLTQTMPTIALGDKERQDGWGAAFDDVYVLNANTLLNFRYGLTFVPYQVTRYSQGFDLSALGFSPSLINLIRSSNDPAGIAFPQVQIESSAYTDLSTGGGNFRNDNYQTFSATLTRSLGSHSLRIGGEYRLLRENGAAFGAVAPQLLFANTYTKGPLDNAAGAPIGQGLASLLLGIPTGGKIDSNASRSEQSTFTGVFVQDDWRITRRLTLNLGIRYEYEAPSTERYNRSISGFDFSAASPVAAQVLANYARAPLPELPVSQFRLNGGLLFAGVNGQSRGLWRSDVNNFAPRVGLAFQLTPKTVIRAGYGIFYDQLGVDQQDVNQGGFNQATNIIPTNNNGINYVATLSNPFPNGVQAPTGAGAGLSTSLGRAITFFNPDPVNPYMQRWTFSIQRQLPGRLALEVAYVGNRGNKIGVDRQIDAIPAQYLSTSPFRDNTVINYLSQQVTNPFAGIPEFAGTTLANSTVARSQLLRPFPQFTGITETQSIGWSYYHALQVQAEKRYSNGLTLLSSYTFSKLMQATTFQNESDLQLEKVISDLDVPHRFVMSGIYELPFGRGRHFLGQTNRWIDSFLGGWQAQGWFEGQTGQALGFGNAIFYGDLHDITLPRDQRKADMWFNINAGFERDNTKTLANNIRRFSSRFNDVRSDGINNFDLSVFKNFRFTERQRVQFRVESFNALNHVQFANPNTTPTSTAFGTVTGEKGHGQRQVTLALKYYF